MGEESYRTPPDATDMVMHHLGGCEDTLRLFTVPDDSRPLAALLAFLLWQRRVIGALVV
jgi:hypothetical protein